jgi:hypothetical protein
VKQVAKLGSHLLISVSHSNISTLSNELDKLIVGDLWDCAYTNCIAFLSDNVLLNSSLSLKMFPDIPEDIARSSMGIGTCWICKPVM